CSSVFGWEPRDDVKGDVARILFYMATRYEGENGEVDLELTETLQSQSAKDPFHATLSVLLEWHELDPVSAFETNRNNAIFDFQGNRNPYIDHPEWVELVFGEEEEIPLSVVENDFTELSIYPNPMKDGKASLSFNNIDSSILTIRDHRGAILSQSTVNGRQVELDLSSYSNGVYLITILSTKGESAILRVVR
ncbi:MAG: endonuclease, partial [Bacteroidota bacterium]